MFFGKKKRIKITLQDNNLKNCNFIWNIYHGKLSACEYICPLSVVNEDWLFAKINI